MLVLNRFRHTPAPQRRNTLRIDSEVRGNAADCALAAAVSGDSAPTASPTGNGPETDGQRVVRQIARDDEVVRAREAVEMWVRVAGLLILALSAFGVIYLATAVNFIGQRVPDNQPPLVFSSHTYQPFRTLLCARDVLTYESVATATKGPVWPIGSESLRYMGRRVWSKDIEIPPYIPGDAGRVLTTTINLTLTKDMNLRPGPYQYLRYFEERSGISDPQWYTVDFTVVECHQQDWE